MDLSRRESRRVLSLLKRLLVKENYNWSRPPSPFLGYMYGSAILLVQNFPPITYRPLPTTYQLLFKLFHKMNNDLTVIYISDNNFIYANTILSSKLTFFLLCLLHLI